MMSIASTTTGEANHMADETLSPVDFQIQRYCVTGTKLIRLPVEPAYTEPDRSHVAVQDYETRYGSSDILMGKESIRRLI